MEDEIESDFGGSRSHGNSSGSGTTYTKFLCMTLVEFYCMAIT